MIIKQFLKYFFYFSHNIIRNFFRVCHLTYHRYLYMLDRFPISRLNSNFLPVPFIASDKHRVYLMKNRHLLHPGGEFCQCGDLEGTKCRSVGPAAVGGDQSVRALYGTAGVQRRSYIQNTHRKTTRKQPPLRLPPPHIPGVGIQRLSTGKFHLELQD